MLLSTTPLAVLVILALLGERFTKRNLLRLGLGLGGVYLVVGPGGNVDMSWRRVAHPHRTWFCHSACDDAVALAQP